MWTLPPELLAKSRQLRADGSERQPEETLEQHTFNVVTMLAALARRSPGLAELSGLEDFWHAAFWTAVVHDFGKVAVGFQQMLRGGARFEERHEVLSTAFLPWVITPETVQAVQLGVLSHHRDAPVVHRLYQGASGVPELEEARMAELLGQLRPLDIGALATWLPGTPERWRRDLGFDRLGVRPLAAPPAPLSPQDMAGAINEALLRYAATERRMPHLERRWGTLLRGVIQQADRLASAHAPEVRPLALPDGVALAARLSATRGRNITFRDHQLGAARPGHLILRAPTGSGKTEAALMWAHAQQADLDTPVRLTYLLPYQASLNAMEVRLERDLNAAGQVGLLHGRALQVLYRHALASVNDDQTSLARQAETVARQQRDYGKLHGPPVSVATPYQLLRAAYRLPGYETIYASVAGTAIVMDEVHAYEGKRLGMFLALLSDLVDRWGARVCAITATMPEWLRSALEGILDVRAQQVPDDVAYANTRHRLELRDAALEDQATLDEIVRRIESGQSVLVAANTVKKAQQVYLRLQNRLGDRTMLLHSRLTGRDRLKREQHLDALLNADRAGEPVAVVATQVIEVSLDLDFDTIVTELAPLEALVQRFGRVNRRGVKGVTVDVSGHQQQVVPVTVLTQPRSGQYVYDDGLVASCLEQLTQAMQTGNTLLHDVNITAWLAIIYSGERLDALKREVDDGQSAFEEHLRHLQPFNSDEEIVRGFEELFDGLDVLPAAFLGDYLQLREESAIEARSLLVPISQRQKNRYSARIQWDKELKLWVADLPYHPALGLQFPETRDRPPGTDEWGEL